MVLGSGLGGFKDNLKEPVFVTYEEIPHWKTGNVKGHNSKLWVGPLKTDPNCYVVIMQGRLHIYEGYSAYDVSYPIRVFN